MNIKYKHALFLNPYIENGTTTTMSLFPPTGLEYVATSARDYVGKISLIDLRCEKELCDPENLVSFIRREDVDIICVTISWNRHFDEICKLLNLMPEGIPIVVGGYKASEEVEEIFRLCPKVNIIVRGEGEETIKEIMKDMPVESILGVSYRKDGNIIHNANRPLPDINTITPPDRRLRRYRYTIMANGIQVTKAAFDTILSSRGCPFNCKFCTFSLNPLGQKRGYVSRTAESVVDEIQSTPSNIILFSDDNFFVEPKRTEKICDLIIARKIKKRFVAQARIDLANNPALLAKIVKAGFKMLLLGIESPHDRILEDFNKGFNQATIRKCFKVFKKYPIFYHGNYIYGNIGETEDEMMYIAKFSKEIGVDSVAFSKLRLDKYSPLKEVVENTPGYHITAKGELYSDTYSHAALKKIHRRMKFSFYTPLRVVSIVRKFIRVRFFTFGEMMSCAASVPALFYGVVAREIHKKRLMDSMKRIFISNA